MNRKTWAARTEGEREKDRESRMKKIITGKMQRKIQEEERTSPRQQEEPENK